MNSGGSASSVLSKAFKNVLRTKSDNSGCFNVLDKSAFNNIDNKYSYSVNDTNNNAPNRGIGRYKVNGCFSDIPNGHCRNGRSSEMVGYCRSPVERKGSPTGSIASSHSQSQLTPSRQLTDGERLKKVILELIETERTYVKHLSNLIDNYLEPLRSAPFLSSAEVSALFGNILEIVAFQRLFLQALTEAIESDPAFSKFEQPHEFKNVLFSVGSAFLYYAAQFKLYSSFCASHSKAQKVLHPSEGNQALQEFLRSRNPKQQHSATLESYLIKPIQRILKYPLLLQQLKALTEPGSDEHRHLVEALKVMEKVAEHINEMQRIHEEYGAIFDHLFRQYQKSMKTMVDLSPGDLLYYGGVEWLNISEFLGKIKKGLELHAMCFVFKTAVVFLCKERLRQKKKLMGGSGKNGSAEVEIIRYQVLIPVSEVQVRASNMKDMDNHYLWELIHLKSQSQRRSEKVYHLSNSTSEFRNAFLKTIRQIIRESVRNMNLPHNKPGGPSSGSSGTGSGGMGGSSGRGMRSSTSTLQHSRSGGGKSRHTTSQTGSLQRHPGAKYDYDDVESYDNVPDIDSPQCDRALSKSSQHSSAHHLESSTKNMSQPIKPLPRTTKPQQHSQTTTSHYGNQSQYQYSPHQSSRNQHQDLLDKQHQEIISQKQLPRQCDPSKPSREYQNCQSQYLSELKLRQQQQQLSKGDQSHLRYNGQRPVLKRENSESFDSDPQQESLRLRGRAISDPMDELSDSTTRSDGGRDEFGIRSEGEDDFSERQQSQKDICLGRTPNHLSLSTTSTLSTGSTSSQARLIQASNQPSNYQPAKGSGSPIWKPRECFGSNQSVKSSISGSTSSISRVIRTGGRVAPVDQHLLGNVNNNNQKNLERSFENLSFDEYCEGPPKRQGYFCSKRPNNLFKAQSSFDIFEQNFRNNPINRYSTKEFTTTHVKYQRNGPENTSEILPNITTLQYFVENHYTKEKYLPRMKTVKTSSDKIIIQNASLSDTGRENYFKESSLRDDRSCDLPESRYLNKCSSNLLLKPKNVLSYSVSVDNSPRSSASSSSLHSQTSSSMFVKDGQSFKLLKDEDLNTWKPPESEYTECKQNEEVVLRKKKTDLGKMEKEDNCNVSRKNKIEETFNRLSASLINCDPWADKKERVNQRTNSEVDIDIILTKLQEINDNSCVMPKDYYERKFFIPRTRCPYGASQYNCSSTNKLPRSSSSFDISAFDRRIKDVNNDGYGDYDDLSLLSLVKDTSKNETDFSQTIDVLNKTAHNIDSLIDLLRNF